MFLVQSWTSAQTRTVTDMVGRKVTIPTTIHSVFSSNPIGTTLIYCLNPDKLAGWNRTLTSGEKKFVDKKYQFLPVIGAWSGNPKTLNKETLLLNKPDIILASPAVAAQVSVSQTIQEETGIPVLIIDQNILKTGEMIRFVADITGEKQRGEELASYADKVLAENKTLTDSVSDSEKKRVYYAEGAKGLQTDPPKSFHAEIIDITGGINVATVSAKSKGVVGGVNISFEQLALWNPDIILISDNTLAHSGKGFYKTVDEDPLWSTLTAVKNKNYYRIPTDPWDWLDRPPSVTRLIGIKWLESILYPDKIKFNLVNSVKSFYKLFYRVNLSIDEVNKILYPDKK